MSIRTRAAVWGATIALLILEVVAGPAASSSCDALAVRDAWVRRAAVEGSPSAGYVQLINRGEVDITVIDVQSPDFGRVAMCRTDLEQGDVRMRFLGDGPEKGLAPETPWLKQRLSHGVTVPAGGHVALEPGARHLMLFEPRAYFSAGDSVRVQLQLQCGGERTVRHVTMVVRHPADS